MGRRGRFVAGILIVFWVLFFWRQIALGEVWYCCDNLLVNIPSKVFLAQELKHGRFPILNPYLFSGTPFFADINLAVLHPFNLLYLVLPPFRALTVGILGLFLVGSLGMYFLGRMLRLGRFASAVGAVVFGFSGTLVVYANNVSILQVAVLVPWVLAFWIRYLDVPNGKRLATFVLMASFQVISGHPQLTFYTWLVLLVYSRKNALRNLIKAGFFIFLVSAVQLVPFLAFAFSSTRVGGDFASATANSVHPLSLVRLILPGIVGNLAGGTVWIQAGTIHGYVGLLPLVLAPLAWRRKMGKFFIVIAIVSVLMAMGKYTPVFWLAYHFIPGIAWFREPSQFLFLWSFAIAAASMVAADSLAREGKPAKPKRSLAAAIIPGQLLEKVVTLPAPQVHAVRESVTYNLSLYSVLALLAAFSLERLRLSSLAKVVVLAVLFADLYVYGQTNVTTIPEATVTGWQESTRARLASWKLSGQYRYYTDPAVYPNPAKKPFGQFNDPGESAWQFAILRPNTGMLYGLSAVDGYASMVDASYQRSFGADGRAPTGVVIPSVAHPRLAQGSVRYIITKPNNPLLADEARYRLLTVDGDIAVYEDSKAVPITFAKEIE